MAHAGVDDQHPLVARCAEYRRDRLHRAREARDIIAERFAESAGSMKSRCMSMMTSAMADQSSSIGSGSATTVALEPCAELTMTGHRLTTFS